MIGLFIPRRKLGGALLASAALASQLFSMRTSRICNSLANPACRVGSCCCSGVSPACHRYGKNA